MPVDAEGVDPSAHLARIEAQPRTLAATQSDGAELIGVRVDPGAIDAAPARNLGRGYQPAHRRIGWIDAHQLGDAPGQRLDGLVAETNLCWTG